MKKPKANNMNANTNSKVAITLLVAAMIIQFVSYNKRIKSLEQEIKVEATKNNFLLRQFENQAAPYDSVVANNDTVSFYKNGTLSGRSVNEGE